MNLNIWNVFIFSLQRLSFFAMFLKASFALQQIFYFNRERRITKGFCLNLVNWAKIEWRMTECNWSKLNYASVNTVRSDFFF